ncbi:MAG TPA: plastocyanin/azurin family copper-binding protein [Stellaceae bacterium]|nr:plastocyanin/azurin family copper-binding protein [Stellaceae bacterium]
MVPRRRRAGVALALLLCAPLARAAAPGAVAIDNFSFGPASLTVAVGTRVTWTNHDDDPHTVVSAAATPVFKSAALDTDETYAFVFTEKGIYKYFCSIHPRMQGTVIVE